MNVRATHTTLAAAGGLVLAALPALAGDLTIVSKASGPGGPTTATTYMAADKFRHSGGESDSIMEYATGRIITIDHKKKAYWETTLDEMRAMMQKADEQMKAMTQQLQQNPQAAAMMQKMMGGAMGGPIGEVTVQKGTTARRIAGYDCDQYVISVGDALKTEVWATTALQPPAQMYEMRKALAMPNAAMGQRFARLYEEMRKIKGYPLAETTTFKAMGPAITTSSEATEVKTGPIPASAFEVPAGYKKVDSPLKAMR